MTKRIMIAASGVAAAVLFSGCADKTPSHSVFAARVKAICEATGKRRDQAAQGFDFQSFDPDTSDLAPLIPIVEKHVVIGRDTAAQLDALRGSVSDVAKVDKWLALAAKMHEIGDRELAALRAGDRAAFKALGQQEDNLHGRVTRCSKDADSDRPGHLRRADSGFAACRKLRSQVMGAT